MFGGVYMFTRFSAGLFLGHSLKRCISCLSNVYLANEKRFFKHILKTQTLLILLFRSFPGNGLCFQLLALLLNVYY